MAGDEKQAGEQKVQASELIRAGKYRDALAICVREHGAALGRYCMAVLGEQREAEEAVLQALGVAYDAMPYWEADSKVRTWLFGLARRICIRRVEARRSVYPGPLAGEEDNENAPSEELLKKRKRAQSVRQELNRLKPAERDVVILRYHSGLSWGDIATICDASENDIRDQASRALLRLREFIKEKRAE